MTATIGAATSGSRPELISVTHPTPTEQAGDATDHQSLTNYPGVPRGITATHQDQVNAELLAFLRAEPRATRPSTRDTRPAAASQTHLPA